MPENRETPGWQVRAEVSIHGEKEQASDALLLARRHY